MMKLSIKRISLKVSMAVLICSTALLVPSLSAQNNRLSDPGANRRESRGAVESASNWTDIFSSSRRQLSEAMNRFAQSAGLSLLGDDLEVRAADDGVFAMALLRREGGLDPIVLEKGVELAVVYIDLAGLPVPPGFYRSKVFAAGSSGRMQLLDANGVSVHELDATLTTLPPTGAIVCGSGSGSHVDGSGPEQTRTMCWAVICSDANGVYIVTGCLVNVPPPRG